MPRYPLLSILLRAGRWLSHAELATASDADYTTEDYMASDLQHHIRRGDIIPRLRDPATMAYEYGLPDWCHTPAPEPDTLLERIQRITQAQWGNAHAHRDPVDA